MNEKQSERKFYNIELNEEREKNFEILSEKFNIKQKSKIIDILLREGVKNPNQFSQDFLNESRSPSEVIITYLKTQHEELGLVKLALEQIFNEIEEIKSNSKKEADLFGKEIDRTR